MKIDEKKEYVKPRAKSVEIDNEDVMVNESGGGTGDDWGEPSEG